jgi:transposase
VAKLGKEQVMVAQAMVGRGTSVRRVAKQMGVTEGALRYRLKKRTAGEVADGRARKATALDGYEAAVETILERLGDARVSGGEGRPAQARLVYEALARDHGFRGSYRSVVRHLARRYGKPRVRALRRVETPPGVQAQHDWWEERVMVGGVQVLLYFLVGVLSHSRARFCWASRACDQLAWHTGHVEMFRRYGGVPLWVRIDNLATGVSSGAGPTAVLNATYARFARQCGFEVDPCRARTGSDKGKVERSVRLFRGGYGDLLRKAWSDLETLQTALDRRSAELMRRHACPVRGGAVEAAWEAEKPCLQHLAPIGAIFDVVVSRPVSPDCLVSFEGRRYSVPFAWVGREVEVLGTAAHVVVMGGGKEIARHPRRTEARLLLDPAHFEGESTDRVIRPTPLGRRAELQVRGLSSPSRTHLGWVPPAAALSRPMAEYAQLVEALA